MARRSIIVTDLDRTFTDTRLRLVPQALAVIRQARRRGHRTILATGRTLPELRRKTGLLALFDGLIVEGGAMIGTAKRLRPTRDGARAVERLAEWLDEKGIPYRRGACSLSISRADLPRLQPFPRMRAFRPTPNRNRVDLTLSGVDKASALRRLLRSPPNKDRKVIAFGDGENDIRLLQTADWGVAVANAVPPLRAVADDVTRYNGGRGVADYLLRNILW